MGTETKKEAATGKEFKPFLTAQDVKAALEQRHVDLLSESKIWRVFGDMSSWYDQSVTDGCD